MEGLSEDVPETPGQGRIRQIDAEMRSVEIAGIDPTGDTGVGWNRSINFGSFPAGVLTEMYNVICRKEAPAMWIGPYSPTQFRTGNRRHRGTTTYARGITSRSPAEQSRSENAHAHRHRPMRVQRYI